MQARLRVRVSLRGKHVRHVITKEDVIDMIKSIRSNFSSDPMVYAERFDLHDSSSASVARIRGPGVNAISEAEIDAFASNFTASISVIKPTNLIDLGFEPNSVHYFTKIRNIAVVDLELGTAADEPAKSVRFLTAKSNYVMAAIAKKLSQINSDCDMIFIKNNYDKTESVIVEPNRFSRLLKGPAVKQILTKKEPRYRLYLDDVMVIERIYPMELNADRMLEELLYVEINKGLHDIRIEMVDDEDKGFEFNITDLAIEDQIFPRINANSCSVEFR
jgi:hypothetical protein